MSLNLAMDSVLIMRRGKCDSVNVAEKLLSLITARRYNYTVISVDVNILFDLHSKIGTCRFTAFRMLKHAL